MTKSSSSLKPRKPRPDFPLWVHPSDRWCKKVRGKFHYFGKASDDPRGIRAFKLWTEQRDDIYAYGKPREHEEGLTVASLCNAFLTSKQRLLESSELSRRSFANYHRSTDKLVNAFGKHAIVTGLTPEDFERLRHQLAKGRGPVSLGNDVRNVRMVFKYGYDAGLLDRPVRFGPSFRVPAKRVMRQARRENGKRMFQAEEIRSLIAAATQPMKSMILLGINCALGNTDVSSLTMDDLDLDNGWLDFPRPKTSIERLCPLWKETVAAIREWMDVRPASATEPDVVFLTKYGQRWLRVNKLGSPIDAVASEFGKLLRRPRCPQCGCINRTGRGETRDRCDACGWQPSGMSEWTSIHRPRLNFYALRHTVQTVGEGARDLPALRMVMGHSDPSISGVYREEITDDRLQAVTDFVWQWLWG